MAIEIKFVVKIETARQDFSEDFIAATFHTTFIQTDTPCDVCL